MILPYVISSPITYPLCQSCHSEKLLISPLDHLLYPLSSTAGPQIILFHERLIRYNIDEEKKKDCQYSHCLSGDCTVFPMSAWVFSRYFCFLLRPKDEHLRWSVCLSCPSLSDCGCVCEWSYEGRASCTGWVSILCAQLPGRAVATCDPELEEACQKIFILFVIIHRSIGYV